MGTDEQPAEGHAVEGEPEDEAPLTGIAAVRAYAELRALRKECETALNDVKAQLTKLEEPVLEFYSEEGLRNMRIAGYNVYQQREIYVSPVEGDYEAACDVLRAEGHEDLVNTRFFPQTVASWINGMMKTLAADTDRDLNDVEPDEVLSDELRKVLKVTTDYGLRAREG